MNVTGTVLMWSEEKTLLCGSLPNGDQLNRVRARARAKINAHNLLGITRSLNVMFCHICHEKLCLFVWFM